MSGNPAARLRRWTARSRLLVEFDVVGPQSRELAAAHPTVEEEPDHFGPPVTGERHEVVQNVRLGYRIRWARPPAPELMTITEPCLRPWSRLWARTRLWSKLGASHLV